MHLSGEYHDVGIVVWVEDDRQRERLWADEMRRFDPRMSDVSKFDVDFDAAGYDYSPSEVASRNEWIAGALIHRFLWEGPDRRQTCNRVILVAALSQPDLLTGTRRRLLEHFGTELSVIGVGRETPAPVITRYEFVPTIRSERVDSLESAIASVVTDSSKRNGLN